MSTSDTGDLRDQVREVIAGRVEALGRGSRLAEEHRLALET